MRLGVLLREAAVGALTSRVATALVLVVSAAMCIAALLTSGQAQANRAEVQGRLASDASRVLAVTVTDGSGVVNPATVIAIEALDSTRATIGLGLPEDVVNSALGRGSSVAPMWDVVGDVTSAVRLTQGRWPQPGEALASRTVADTFGLAGPVGGAQTTAGREVPIVGIFEPTEAFADLGAGIVVAAPVGDAAGSPDLVSVRALVESTTAVAATQRAALEILQPPDLTQVQVDSPASAARTAMDLDAQLADYARAQLVTVVGVGALLVAGVVIADVLIRSRDLGRRRTLGITRADLVLLVCARTGIAAVAGALLGCLAAAVVPGIDVPARSIAGIGVLAVVAAILAAIPPSVYAAHRDPVRVMRTA